MGRPVGFYTDEEGRKRPITPGSGVRKLGVPKQSLLSAKTFMQRVHATEKGDKLYVRCPYDPAFDWVVQKYHARLSGKSWVFPKSARGDVKLALDRIYGETGEGPVEVVNVHVKVDPFLTEGMNHLWLFNRKVFNVHYGGYVTVGDRTVGVKSGDLPKRVSKQDISELKGRGIEVFIPFVPRKLAERYARQKPNAIKIIE